MASTTTSRRKSIDTPGRGPRNAKRDLVARTSSAARPEALAQQSEFNVVSGRPGDHLSAHRLLIHLFHRPSMAEFQSQLEDPFYEPSDRLLVKRGDQLVGHTLLTKREMHFGASRIACGAISDLGVLPEYRSRGCGSQLLAAAEDRLQQDGAAFGILRTASPGFFQRRGWAPCFRHSFSIAGARDILSHLLERPRPERSPLDADAQPLTIRVWRHVEQVALMRLYEQYSSSGHAYGPLVRSEAYWRWLLSRRAFDRIYIAVNGPDKLALDDTMMPIVGYAAIRKARIVELVTAPDFPQAAEQLLCRACGDAIEQDDTYVRLDASPEDPLHAVFSSAGGESIYHEAENSDVLMVKAFRPLALLESQSDMLLDRIRAADRPMCSELGLLVDGEKHLITIRPKSVHLSAGKLGRSYIECGSSELTQLILGHLDVDKAVESERIQPSTRVAHETAASLFPTLPTWRPPLDGLQV